MKMVYASRWMLDALASAGQPKSVLLNLPALLNTLSADDVAVYVALNKNLAAFIPEPILGSFTKVSWDLSDERLKKVRDALVRLEVAGTLPVPEEASQEAMDLTCDLFDADAIVFQHILKEAESPKGAHRVAHLAERILRQLHTVLRYETLMVLPVARWYLEARQSILTPNRVIV